MGRYLETFDARQQVAEALKKLQGRVARKLDEASIVAGMYNPSHEQSFLQGYRAALRWELSQLHALRADLDLLGCNLRRESDSGRRPAVNDTIERTIWDD